MKKENASEWKMKTGTGNEEKRMHRVEQAVIMAAGYIGDSKTIDSCKWSPDD